MSASPDLPADILRLLRATGRTHRTYAVAASFGMHRTDEAYAAFSAALDSLGDRIIRVRGAHASITAA